MSTQQKYVTALNVCKNIANTLSQASQEHFERRLAQLTSLQDIWNEGCEVGFQTFSDYSQIDGQVQSAEGNPAGNSVSGDQNIDLNSNENLTSDEFTETPQFFEVSPITKPAELYIPPILSVTDVFEPDELDSIIDLDVMAVITSLIDNVVFSSSIEYQMEGNINESLTITKIGVERKGSTKRFRENQCFRFAKI